MIGQRLLIRRTARLLTASRLMLVTAFVTAILLDPDHVPQAGGLIFWLLRLYLAWAGFLAVTAWRNWWWEFRLARPAHAIDITVFILAMFLVETGHSYASPYLAFTAFLLITAMARWGKQAVALTGIVLVGSYALISGLEVAIGAQVDAYQLARRVANMAVLSFMMSWFGAGVRVPLIDPMPEPDGIPGKRNEHVMASALDYARSTFNAQGAAIALLDRDETGHTVFRTIDGRVDHQRVDPSMLSDDLDTDTDAMLFDSARQRRIASSSDRLLRARQGPFGSAMADLCQVQTGLIARLSSAKGDGLLLVWGLPIVSLDDLPVIRALAREVGLALDREEMVELAQSVAVGHLRNALARDLHDSAAQFLAGTLFRLEALRRGIREGRDPETEILAMRGSLRQEQAQLRSLIDRLRLGGETDRSVDIVAELDALMRELGNHWHIGTTLDAPIRPLPVAIDLAHELRLLVREAVANAVRHGQCSRIGLMIEPAPDGSLQVSIGDNGKGFDADDCGVYPRSISERIAALGGELRIDNGAAGVRLDIALPPRIAA